MSQRHVQTGTGTPSSTSTTPDLIGAHYVDTSTNEFYISVGTSGPGDYIGPFGGGLNKDHQQVTIPGDGSGVTVTHGLNTEAFTVQFFRQDTTPEEPIEPEWNKVSGNEKNAIELFWNFQIDVRTVIIG